MTNVRLLADDLTGALDTAAEFIALCGPFDVTGPEGFATNSSPGIAIDSGTRELAKAESAEIVGRLAPLLHEGTIAYKKVDSLLRGAWAAELGACLRSGHWASCVVAPAFDYQGRRTRDGQQFARTPEGDWYPVGKNLLAQLNAENIDARQGRPDTLSHGGVQVFDAESDRDLDRVVEMGRRLAPPILWCGSGGLAGALAPGSRADVATRKAVCGAFGAQALQVTGRSVPGLPRSILQGGRWAGVEVISKSGAFGTRELWRDLLQDNQLLSIGKPT